MSERTNEELADALDLLKLGVTGEAWKSLDEAARRLRAMPPEGAREFRPRGPGVGVTPGILEPKGAREDGWKNRYQDHLRAAHRRNDGLREALKEIETKTGQQFISTIARKALAAQEEPDEAQD